MYQAAFVLTLCVWLAVLQVGCTNVQESKAQDTASPQKQLRKLYIIVHKDNPVTTVTPQELKNIYLGRQHRWSDSQAIESYDYPPLMEVFYEQVLAMPLQEINRYWSQQKIIAMYRRPLIIERIRELLPAVQQNKGSVAYVTTRNLPPYIKIIGEFNVTQ
jgi:hypothetical protein